MTFNYVSKHQTLFRNVPAAGNQHLYPETGQNYIFEDIAFPSIFSIGAIIESNSKESTTTEDIPLPPILSIGKNFEESTTTKAGSRATDGHIIFSTESSRGNVIGPVHMSIFLFASLCICRLTRGWLHLAWEFSE